MSKTLTWFYDSPDTGHPDCKCSLCGLMIDEVPIRVFDPPRDREMRFHMKCAIKKGILSNEY
ncbi:hypothetical protein LCGC14_1463490 [marine sediment metagenome]|uniref:PARP-type domain-containing protein n=1 Tax=marine sediment metagenome TaxID=412755 RepID=A0A0F9LUY7_9ZZZZ